jgi:hypothetical protein
MRVCVSVCVCLSRSLSLSTDTVLSLEGQQDANDVTRDESRAGVLWFVVLCLWSGHSKLWALLMVVVNLWNGPGFQFEYLVNF